MAPSLHTSIKNSMKNHTRGGMPLHAVALYRLTILFHLYIHIDVSPYCTHSDIPSYERYKKGHPVGCPQYDELNLSYVGIIQIRLWVKTFVYSQPLGSPKFSFSIR